MNTIKDEALEVGEARICSCGCNSSGAECVYHKARKEGYKQGLKETCSTQHEKGVTQGALLTLLIVFLLLARLHFTNA